MKEKSVKSNNPCKSLPCRQAGVIQTKKDKIFQPFFTTKPTGSGTGLGLSLSYDIAKAHGRKLVVDSGLGEVTTFVLTIPTNL